jgi:hypothetical protein
MLEKWSKENGSYNKVNIAIVALLSADWKQSDIMHWNWSLLYN